MTQINCNRLRCRAALAVPICLAVLLAGAAATRAHTDPPGATLTAVDHSLAVFLDPACSQNILDVRGASQITSCETVYLQAQLRYASQVSNAASFEGGAGADWRLQVGGSPVADLGNVPCLGVPGLSQDDPNAPGGRGQCQGTTGQQISACVPYAPTPADIANGTVNFESVFGNPNPFSPDTAYAHLGANDLPGVSSSVPQFLLILTCGECETCTPGACVPDPVSTPCTDDDGNLCTMAGCDGAGTCNQDHLTVTCDDGECFNESCDPATGQCDRTFEPPSTPCTDTDGNLCTDAGCDGAGTCNQDHLTVTCDDGECFNESCDPATGQCDRTFEPPSTPCTDTDGNLCTDAGCDGAGTCNQDHLTVTCDDGECFNESCDPATGQCDRTFEPPSTPCTDTDGNLCTDAGCDGAGTCNQDHLTVTCDDGECFNESCDPATGQCDRTLEPPSTPCTDTDGNLCTDAGCDGAGNCNQDHVTVTCDDGECFNESCDPATGQCDRTFEPPSTPCTDTDGTLCTDAGCDGAGTCNQDHETVTCQDGECFAESCDPATGQCDRTNDPPSTPCDDSDGDLCTIAGCDGAGECNQDHEQVTCQDGVCFDEACDPATGQCERTCAPDGRPECEIDIGDFIWDDTNMDGVQDTGEAGIDGVTVTLTDCGNVIASDVTGGGGIYAFSGIDIVDDNCEPGPVNLEVVVDTDTLPLGFANESPRDVGDDAFDSDCDAGVIGCAPYGASTNTLDCGFFEVPVESICRTPGFWGARGGSKPSTVNYTQAVIDAAGCLNVCGVDICGTVAGSGPGVPLGNLGSAIEGNCVRSNDPSQLNQAFRQMTAAALNCSLSGASSDCGAFLDAQTQSDPGTWEACNLACADPAAAIAAPGSPEAEFLVFCSSLYDDFNNGRFGDCHDREICDSPIFPADDPDVRPYWDGSECALGGASHGGACKAAIANSCSISNDYIWTLGGGGGVGPCDENPCIDLCNPPPFAACEPDTCGTFTECEPGADCFCYELYEAPGTGGRIPDAACGVDCSAGGDADCSSGEVCIFNTCCGYPNCVPAESSGSSPLWGWGADTTNSGR